MTVKASDVLTEEVVRQRMEDIVQENLQFRQAFRSLDVTSINSDTFKVPRPTDEIGLPEAIPEGAEFPRDEENYEKVNINWDKYGFEVALTREGQADSMIDVKADQMERQARQMQERLNELAFNELEGNRHATLAGDGNDTMSFSDVVDGRQTLRQDNFSPDLLLVDIEAEQDLLTDSNFTHATDLGDNTLTEGAIGRVAGLDVIVTDAGHISGDGTPTAYIVDTDFYGYEATREPIMTNQYDDPERQANIIQIWTRKGFKAIEPNAAIRVDG